MIAGAGRDLHNLPLLEHLPDKSNSDHEKMQVEIMHKSCKTVCNNQLRCGETKRKCNVAIWPVFVQCYEIWIKRHLTLKRCVLRTNSNKKRPAGKKISFHMANTSGQACAVVISYWPDNASLWLVRILKGIILFLVGETGFNAERQKVM